LDDIIVLNMQYQVGDLVKLKARPDKDKRAVVYEQYPDFDDNSKWGVSLITEVGQDLGGFSFQEQQDYLELVKHKSQIEGKKASSHRRAFGSTPSPLYCRLQGG
jgi:hypothetical protein